MMADFAIRPAATAAVCQDSYDKSLAGCAVNYPVEGSKANRKCRKRARAADRVCRRQIGKN